MSQTKVLYILSNIDKAIAFEWISNKINKDKFTISFILLNNTPSYLHQYLLKNGIESVELPYGGKKDIIKTFFKVLRLLRKWNPQVVHTHLFDANLIGLLAAKLLGIPKRIFTRHHSTFHHVYAPHGVKWDKLSDRLATDIIAISENVKQVLINKENTSKNKITLIHHGFDLAAFQYTNNKNVSDLKRKYNPNNKRPVIGLISRYIHWKGIHYIIPAFKEILRDYPDAILLLANAKKGDYVNEINQLLKELPPENYVEIDFEKDLFSLYQLFDVFVHTPIDGELEAFGQIYVEALAAGIPSVFTLSGIALEFIQDGQNALVVDYKNTTQIKESILRILADENLRNQLVAEGKQSAQQFSVENMIKKLEALYEK